jgi:REP element-mobilizing transposase RayT
MIEHNPHNIPLAYLMTFTCYGTWLHGDKRGSVDAAQNQFGEPFLEEDSQREQEEFKRLKHVPVYLSQKQRDHIAQSIDEVCKFRGWKLWEVNVRTNHVHVVLSSSELPKKIFRDLKSRSTMNLKSSGLFAEEKLWTRGGSGRYLWKEDAVEAACRYVQEQ